MKTSKMILLSLAVLLLSTILPAEAKDIKYGQYITYKGEVVDGKPQGKGTLTTTNGNAKERRMQAIRNMSDTYEMQRALNNYDHETHDWQEYTDCLSGTFEQGGIVRDAELVFASGWKFKGALSFSIDRDGRGVTYLLQRGWLLAVCADAEYEYNVLNVLPVDMNHKIEIVRAPGETKCKVFFRDFQVLITSDNLPEGPKLRQQSEAEQMLGWGVKKEDDKMKELKKEYEQLSYEYNHRSANMNVDFILNQMKKVKQQMEELEKEQQTQTTSNINGNANIVTSTSKPFKEMESQWFGRSGLSRPNGWLNPLQLSDFPHPDKYIFHVGYKVQAAKYVGVMAEQIDPAYDRIAEPWTLIPSWFLIEFEDGWKVGTQPIPEEILFDDEIAAMIKERHYEQKPRNQWRTIIEDEMGRRIRTVELNVVTRPNSEDEFIYQIGGQIYYMKSTRPDRSMELKGDKQKNDFEKFDFRYKMADGKTFKGIGMFYSGDGRRWIFQNLFVSDQVKAHTWDDFQPITGTMKLANGKTEEYKDKVNLAAKALAHKADVSKYEKALALYRKRYGAVYVNALVDEGIVKVGAPIAMVKAFVADANFDELWMDAKYPNRNRTFEYRYRFEKLYTRQPYLSEVRNLGSGLSVYILDDPLVVLKHRDNVLYVRGGKVIRTARKY